MFSVNSYIPPERYKPPTFVPLGWFKLCHSVHPVNASVVTSDLDVAFKTGDVILSSASKLPRSESQLQASLLSQSDAQQLK